MENSQIKILLIDDDEDDYVLTRDWCNEFQVLECQLEWIDNYQDAQQAITNGQQHICLLDYRLGDRNGLELLTSVIADGCSTPIIVLTGQGEREIDIQAMAAGAADYLEKSLLNAPLLERSIRYALERKRAQETIKAQAALLNVATDAIFVQDLTNTILFWNQAAAKLYGWSKAQAIGKQTSQLWQEKQTPLQTALSTVLKDGAWQGELQQTTKDNADIVVESRWTLVSEFEHQSPSILVVNTDITQKKILEGQLLRSQRLESIGTLASGIAHDLNNVFAPILMTAQLLESYVDSDRTKQLIPILINSAKRGANLVKQVLAFTSGVECDRTLLQISDLITEIHQVIYETFPKSIQVSCQTPENLWMVLGDSLQLHQVLMNLCVNARDAMPNGGSLSIYAANFLIDDNYAKMHLDAKPGAYVVITVTDTGVGIPQNILDRIFEPFFTSKEPGKGTGLGLSTVLGITKSHGGFVNVYSEVGKGSQFKVYLPARQTPETREEPDTELTDGNGEVILVVDDEDSIRDITKTSLEIHNYQAITACDGVEAIAIYAENRDRISIVLTDMVMPTMDGITTIRTLKKINPDVKIVAVSGLAGSDKLNLLNKMGVQAFLPKPYTATELLQTIGSVRKREGGKE
ncbi:MAG: response regulator [Calothrix sp. MO_167.B12]|nr:response regulator [Calothrix sp. MO_167.B12]